MGELRATSSKEKGARQRLIVAAAADLLDRLSYTDITMEHIARRAGIAKGTLYLYFRTKEMIFLRLYEDLLDSWFEELESLAGRSSATVGPADAARVISSTLTSRPLLILLQGMLHTRLVENTDQTWLGEFKKRRHRRMSSLASALASRISNLSDDRSLRFLLQLEAVVAGLSWTHPARVGTSLSVFQVDFEDELAAIITALLR